MFNIAIIKQLAISASLFIIAASLLHCGSITALEDTIDPTQEVLGMEIFGNCFLLIKIRIHARFVYKL